MVSTFCFRRFRKSRIISKRFNFEFGIFQSLSQGKFLLNCHSKETIQCLLFVFSGLKILLCKKILWFITYGSGHPVTLHQDALIETGNTEVNNVGTMLPVLIGTSWCNRKSPVVGAREILRFEFSKRNIRKTFSI